MSDELAKLHESAALVMQAQKCGISRIHDENGNAVPMFNNLTPKEATPIWKAIAEVYQARAKRS